MEALSKAKKAKPIGRRARPLARGTAKMTGKSTAKSARATAKSAKSTAKSAKSAAKSISKVSHSAGKVQGRRQARGRARGKFAAFIADTGAGAAAGYLLDPADGKRRRHVLRDRTAATLRQGSREAEKRARDMAAKTQGKVAEATPPGRDSSELNDPALEAKVESELFRPADAPKDSVNVNVENGVVYLRGEIDSRDRMEALVAETRAIDGVSKIESLLHLPGEPAPEKS